MGVDDSQGVVLLWLVGVAAHEWQPTGPRLAPGLPAAGGWPPRGVGEASPCRAVCPCFCETIRKGYKLKSFRKISKLSRRIQAQTQASRNSSTLDFSV